MPAGQNDEWEPGDPDRRNPELLDTLKAIHASIQAQTNATVNLTGVIASDVRHEARKTRFLSAVPLLALVTLAVMNFFLISDTHEASTNSRQSLDTIRDCTTPGGGCYERTQADVARALIALNESSDKRAATAVAKVNCIVYEVNPCFLPDGSIFELPPPIPVTTLAP